MDLQIKNGIVYDPRNEIYGEKLDIFISNGKIVSEDRCQDAKVIDVNNKIVMPGGVDAHSHIAGGKVNAGRIMRPEDGRIGLEPKTKITRSCSGYTVPNVYGIGYRYARLGYTTAFEAAMPLLEAKHTHEELEEIPIIDKAALPLFGSNWMVMEYIKEGDVDKLAAYVAWALNATKGYGIKIVNPGGGEAWGFRNNVKGLDDPVPNFEVTPREIIYNLAKVNEMLNLPHSIHVHCNNLGVPGDFPTVLATFNIPRDIKPSRDRQIMHVTHVMFYSFGGTNWGNVESKADAIAHYLNKHDHVTIDTGQLIFGSATTMTADGPVQFRNARMFKAKWSNHDIELEDASGVTPLFYVRAAPVHAIMWSMGLELALLTEDPWKVIMTTDHPNGGPFVNYPEVISLLMSKNKREAEMSKFQESVQKRTVLPTIDREMSWHEIAVLTRAAPAKILGLENKGHLGIGEDADVSVYNINPEQIDSSTEHAEVKKALSSALYTIKAGEIVVKEGSIVCTPEGRTFCTKVEVPQEYMDGMLIKLRAKFKDYYTVQESNYIVQDHYVPHPITINTQYRKKIELAAA
ncbi:MAG: formylmethanofuran dehydrogenase subunit A [Methanosarcinales archaeon]